MHPSTAIYFIWELPSSTGIILPTYERISYIFHIEIKKGKI